GSTAVSRNRRRLGSACGARSHGLARKRASAAESSATSRSSSRTQARYAVRVGRIHVYSAQARLPIRVQMGRRTLVVDDHPLTRAALVGLLGQRDFPVVGEAGEGEKAITRARELQPDLVLLDLSMPGLGCIESLTSVRAAATD